MMPVAVFMLPHNKRVALYPGELDDNGEELPSLAENYLTLPIRMPKSIMVTYGKGGAQDILAINVPGEGGGRIRREDIATVWEGVCEYNRDCRALGEG